MKKYLLLGVSFAFLSACADMGMGKDAYKRGDYAQAERHYSVLAYQYDLPEAKFNLARTYKQESQPEKYAAEIIRLLNEVKDQDDGAAYYELARIYEDGYGVKPDREAAEKDYARSLAKGYARAQDGLYNIRAQKACETKHYEDAAKYWSILVAKGDKSAALQLAEMYMDITLDGAYDLKIVSLLKQANDQNGGRAYFDLGEIYDEGKLPRIIPDGKKAERYYGLASEAGYWKADFNRARLYDKGELVVQDQPRAKALYAKIWEERRYDRAHQALKRMDDDE